MKYIVPKEITLLEALSLASPDSSMSTLRSWLKQERVLVDEEVVKIGTKMLRKGQTVSVSRKDRPIESGLKILFEDRHLVVVDKPSTLLSVSTAFEEGDTAHAILKRKYRPKRVYVVHRLDQDTSGVMMFALSEEAMTKLKNTFEKHDIERKYDAIIEGHLAEEKGTWQSYLYEDENYFVHETMDKKKGQLAISHYTVIGKSKKYSWLAVTLETGKKNQIRVHCRSAGTPVVGDKKYGAQGNPIKRLGLHAYFLSFRHPITGKKMSFESPAPKAFYRLVDVNS